MFASEMSFIEDLSLPLLAVFVFCLRIGDVSIGTMRTIAVVNARVRLSVLLGFFEVLIWVTAVSSVILRIQENPLLAVAYAGGFAAGNGVGIVLERRLAFGQCALRMITRRGAELESLGKEFGKVVGSFQTRPPESDKSLIMVVLDRRGLPTLLRRAQSIDPDVFWVVERFAETSRLTPLPRPSGWRAVAKMK
jgi:uncharacterized protein YebE (UPF0316 family)